MPLTEEQLAEYDERGFLAAPSVFTTDEVAALNRTLERDWEIAGPHRITADDGRTVRAVYACHTRWQIFADLVRSRRLLEPAARLVAPDLYLHQFKINTKRALGGEEWSWHQDFIVWHTMDNLPEPRAVNVAVLLDEVTEFNGPLAFIPGSHRQATAAERRADSPRSAQHIDPEDFSLTSRELTDLVRRGGIEAPKAPAGSVLFFHPEIVHGSGTNISPFSRNLLILTYNEVSNAPRPPGEPRPEYLIGRDTTPLRPADGTLREGQLAGNPA